VETTWDGLPIAAENPRFVSIVVWRRTGDGHEFLVLHRAHHGADFAGDWAWTNPAGSRQPGEEVVAAALRELEEEVGLELDLVETDLAGDEIAVFVAEAPRDAEVVLDHEHDRFAWVGAEEARRRCLPALVGDVFDAVDRMLRE
jgi:8-oxo-dGTP pyrophosphatase MutT (NUDIX family)